MICSEPACPVERARKALNETLKDAKRAQSETVMSCTFCKKTVGWRHLGDQDIPLVHEEVWGAQKSA
jgi:hypothetical protein